MAQTIKLRRSSTSGAVPTTSSLSLGEVAINTYDGKMYIKKNDGSESVVEVGVNSTIAATTLTGNLSMGDNIRARFGDGNDLQIYHDGNHSYVTNTYASGALKLVSDDFRIENASNRNQLKTGVSGAVQLFFDDGSATGLRLGTTATGISVTGDIVLGDTNPSITFNDSSIANLQHTIQSGSNKLQISTDSNGVHTSSRIEFLVDSTERLQITDTGIDVTGNIGVSGTVDGVDIAARDAILTSTTTTAGAALPKAGGTMSGQLNTGHVKLTGTGTDNDSHTLYFTNGAAAIARDNNDLELHAYNAMIFGVSNTAYPTSTERMRIDSLGNASFNTTNISPSANNVIGTTLLQYGGASMSRTNSVTLDLNRSSSDGDIVYFRRDGTRIGTMTAASGKLQLIGENQNLGLGSGGVIRINLDNSHFYPQTHNATDLGFNAALAFKNLFLSGTASVGGLTVNSAFTFPTADGSANQVLKTDGSGNMSWASVAVGIPTYLADADGDTKVQVEESADEDTIRFDAAGVERFKIGSDVQVMGTTDFNITGANRRFSFTSGTGTVRTTGASSLNFGTNNTDRMTITSAGNLGIGTTAAAQKLHVVGSAIIDGGTGVASTGVLNVRQSGDTLNNGIALTSSHGTSHRIWKDSTGKLNFGPTSLPSAFVQDLTGKVGIGTTTPAYLLHLEDSNGADLALGNSTVSPSAGDYLGRIYALDSTNVFFAGINMFYHDDNDGEMRFRVKTAGTNTDIMTLVDGNVGIGTSSPSEELTIRASVPKIQIEDSDGTNQYGQFYHSAGITSILARNNTSDGTIVFQKYDGTTTDETMRIDASGKVGIGTSSPASPMHLKIAGTGGTNVLSLENDSNKYDFRLTSANLVIRDGSSDRVTLDSSGNLLVGKSADNNAVAGVALSSIGIVKATRTDWSLLLNRLTTDGELALFQKDGTTVGSIGTIFDDLYIGTGDTNIRFDATNDVITPRGSGGSARDAAVDLGSSSVRFKDLRLSGGAYTSFIAGQNDTNTSINFPGSDVTVFYTGGAERMRINSSGDVSIGTTGGSGRRLDVLTANDYVARFASSDSYAGIIIEDSGSTANYNRLAVVGNNMLFDVNNSTRMKITSAGNVGIGTTTPAQKFVVANATNGQGLEIVPGTTNTLQSYNRATSVYLPLNIDVLDFKFRVNNASEAMRIGTNGAVSIGTTTAAGAGVY